VNIRNSIQLSIAFAISIVLSACGGGSGSNPTPPPISVSFLNAPPASLNVSTSTGITAVVGNDNNNAGVSWKVSCGSGPCGTISPASTASGTATTYTPPATVPTPATVTITATSVTDSTKSTAATITITSGGPPPAIAVAFTAQPQSSIVINTSTNIAATVTNDSKNGGVKWAVTCAVAQCGAFNPTTTASGASTAYTAPAAVPSPATVTVTATSVTDSTKSASATVTILATPPPVLADGTYVYQLSGQDNYDSYYIDGAFAIKNGVITGGEQDFSDANLGSSDSLDPSKSSIQATGSNIELVLGTNNTSIGVNGVETLRGTVVSSSRLLISQFDSFAAATGSIDLQTSTATPSGGYAFAINGVDGSSDENQLAIGGVLNFSGSTLSPTGSIFDLNDGADNPLPAQAFTSGSISAPDSFGRITISLTPSSTSGVPSFSLVGYLVDGNKMPLIESVGDDLNADLGGTALAQGSKAGTFGLSTVANTTYVHGSIGQDSFGPTILGGAFIFAPNGSATGLLTFNDLTNINGNTFNGATYQVDPTGRVTVSNIVPSQMTNISLTFQLYLDGKGNALALGNDGIQVTTGLAYQQNGLSDYEGNYAINVQGFLNGENYDQPYGAVGPVTISSDSLNGYTNYTSQDPNLQNPPLLTPFDTYSDTPLNGLEETSEGKFSLSGLNSTAFGVSSGFGFYPIDSNRVLAIQEDSNGIGLLILEGITQAPPQN